MSTSGMPIGNRCGNYEMNVCLPITLTNPPPPPPPPPPSEAPPLRELKINPTSIKCANRSICCYIFERAEISSGLLEIVHNGREKGHMNMSNDMDRTWLKVFGIDLTSCCSKTVHDHASLVESHDNIFDVHAHEYMWWTNIKKEEGETNTTYLSTGKLIEYRSCTGTTCSFSLLAANATVFEICAQGPVHGGDSTDRETMPKDIRGVTTTARDTFNSLEIFLRAVGRMITAHPPENVDHLIDCPQLLTSDGWKRYARFQLGRNCGESQLGKSTIWSIPAEDIGECDAKIIYDGDAPYYCVPRCCWPDVRLPSVSGGLCPSDIIWRTNNPIFPEYTLVYTSHETCEYNDCKTRASRNVRMWLLPGLVQRSVVKSLEYKIWVDNKLESKGSNAEMFLDRLVHTLKEHTPNKKMLETWSGIFYPKAWERLITMLYPSDSDGSR